MHDPELVPLFLQLFFWLVFGGICAALAHSRGRSPVGWFFIGLVAPCLGLILVLVLPDMKRQQHQEQRLREENRRLRERVKKDRLVADRRHARVTDRLSTHDRALGIDTSERREAVEGPLEDPPPLPGDEGEDEATPHDDLAARSWYVAVDGARQGPLDLAGLRELWRSGRMSDASLVWYEGLADWQSVASVDGLRDLLAV